MGSEDRVAALKAQAKNLRESSPELFEYLVNRESAILEVARSAAVGYSLRDGPSIMDYMIELMKPGNPIECDREFQECRNKANQIQDPAAKERELHRCANILAVCQKGIYLKGGNLKDLLD